MSIKSISNLINPSTNFAPVVAPNKVQTVALKAIRIEFPAIRNDEHLRGLLSNVKVGGKELRPLQKALEILLDPNAFAQTAHEVGILPKEQQASIASAVKRTLYADLKKVDPLNGEDIECVIQKAELGALRDRIRSHPTFANKTEEDVDAQMLKVLENQNFEKRIDAFLGDKISKLHAKYEKMVPGFSKLIALYSDRNLVAMRPRLVQSALEARKKRIKDQLIEAALLETIKQEYQVFYDWLALNMSHLKKAYNQGDDDSHNQGEGTCYQNCLDRLALLKKDAAFKSTEVPMLSSPRGRIAQARVNQRAVDAEGFAKQFASVVGSSVMTFGFKDLTPAGIMTELLAKAAKQPLIGILGIKTGSLGHAINIQIDPKNKIYRLIDDNVGVLEFPSAELFKEEAAKLLSILYPGIHTAFLDYPAK